MTPINIESELVALRDRAWTTAACRYNAARRLRGRSRLSLGVISFVSAAGVALPLLEPELVDVSEKIPGLSALLALFILIIAIIESASQFGQQAYALHRNAEDLNAFRVKVGADLATPTRHTEQVLSSRAAEYGEIKNTCPVNHEVVDYNLHRARKPEDFGLKASRFRLLASLAVYSLHSTWWLLLVAAAAAVAVGTVLF